MGLVCYTSKIWKSFTKHVHNAGVATSLLMRVGMVSIMNFKIHSIHCSKDFAKVHASLSFWHRVMLFVIFTMHMLANAREFILSILHNFSCHTF